MCTPTMDKSEVDSKFARFNCFQSEKIIPPQHWNGISTNSRKIFLISLYIYLENGNIYKRQTKKTLADKT